MKTKFSNPLEKTKHILTMNELKFKRIIIQGITETGETFKPHDWAERMSGQLSTFENHRFSYSPLLLPMIKEGRKCISLDPQLKYFYPDLYSSILKFARTNRLIICTEDSEELNDEYR